MRDRRCQQDAEQIARALQGTWREEHLFELRQAVERWEFYHRQISVCDEQIQTHLQTLQDPNAGEPPARWEGAPAETQGQRPAFRCAAGGVPGDEG